MSLHSIIEHRANYYFLKLEEDYVEICQGKHKHCKAAILSILENWMNSKRATTSRESDLYVYLSYPQFVKQMFGLYERSTVITSLKELEQEGLILKRPFKDVFNQDTFEYRLNCPAVQQRLIMLPDKSSAQGSLNLNYPGVNLNDGSIETDGGSFENKRGGSVNLDDGSFKNKRNIESNIDSDIEPTQNTEREVATATARSQSSSQEISQDDEDTVKKEVVHVQNQSHSGNPGNSSQPHLDTGRNSIPLDASLTSQKDVARGHNHQHPVVDHHSPVGLHQSQAVKPEHRKEDTNRNTDPPHPRKPPTNPVPRRPKQQGLMDEIPSLPASKPVEPLADMQWGTRKCLQWFDYWRGGTLIAKHKIMQASTCAKGLAEQFDEQTFIEIRNEMAADQYYIDRGGVDVCDVANNCHKYRNLIRTKQKPPSNEHKAVQHANAFIARGYDKEYNRRKLEEMRAENERRRQAAGGVQ